ncbi:MULTISPECIES: cupin domain-containing protein [Gracilibacillus]|jgi:quercetin dioxygenase-like cupin family protein|uniref:Cupin domain-containing protein n=1 Tax=Gracilibacillus thailandensis TaxID=563735 RepID=A0A6N7QVE0_9BACI|nr:MULTISPECIES: cupin domain-containing protein [Gracilibacillus]MRI64921.1 cupin domain-containing protein [Gracilibacillus thailandensis]
MMAVNKWEQAEPGVTRKIHEPGDQLMMMEVSFEEGAEGSAHSHPHEQLTYCLAGKLAFHVDGKEVIVEQGESLRIPSDAVHGVKALTKSKLLDVFTPLREDLLD